MDNHGMHVPARQRIVFGHEDSEHVTIEIVEAAAHGWLISHVTVCSGGWSGVLTWYIFPGELGRFADQLHELYKNLSGVAELSPLEPNLVLHLSGDGRGHVVVEGKADAHLGNGTHLVFRLNLDQTELPAILKSLSDADWLSS